MKAETDWGTSPQETKGGLVGTGSPGRIGGAAISPIAPIVLGSLSRGPLTLGYRR